MRHIAGRRAARASTEGSTSAGAKRRRNHRLLVIAEGINTAGETLTSTALTVKLFGDSQSFVVVAALMACNTIPIVVWSGRAGRAADGGQPQRLARRALGALGVLLAILAAVPTVTGLILGLVVVVASVYTFADSAIFALIPFATSDLGHRRVVQANMSTARWIGSSLGALAAGFAVEVSYRIPIALDALSYVVAMLIIGRMAVRARAAGGGDEAEAEAEAKVSRLTLLRRYPRVAVAMAILTASIAFLGTTGVLMIGFVERVLHGSAAVYGTLQALYMVGIMIGTLTIRAFARRVRPMAGLMTVCGLSGCFLLLQSVIARLSATVVLYSASGVAHGIDSFCMRTQLTEEAPDEIIGRLFSAFYAAAAAAELASFVLGATLGELLPVRVALAISGGCTVLVVLAALALMPLVNRRVRAPGRVAQPT
jgi:MFS family permease